MRVGIDLTALLPLATGVDNYMLRLAGGLGRVDRETAYTLFVNLEDRRRLGDALPPNFAVVPACLRPRLARLAFQQALLPAVASALRLDVLHSPAFLMPLLRGTPRHVVTVHDMTFFTLPDCHIPMRRSPTFLRGVTASIRRADLVVVPSEAVRGDVLALVPGVLPDRVRVIPLGIGEEFRPPPDGTPRPDRPYVLFVGTLEPRKNVEAVVESYRRLVLEGDVEEDLLLVGRLGWDYDRLLARLEAPELRGRVRRLGYVTQDELVFLYGGARLFVYPSLGEGFGFPPLEALACGTATIVTDSSSLAENLRGAAELVPPDDLPALTEAMRRFLRDPALRAARRTVGLERAARFRWEDTARAMRACYAELAGRYASRAGLAPGPAT
jgi:glycosyltransferase involved in cell wall biosynthesis